MKILIIDSANITFHYIVPFCNAFIKKGIPIKLLLVVRIKRNLIIFTKFILFLI